MFSRFLRSASQPQPVIQVVQGALFRHQGGFYSILDQLRPKCSQNTTNSHHFS